MYDKVTAFESYSRIHLSLVDEKDESFPILVPRQTNAGDAFRRVMLYSKNILKISQWSRNMDLREIIGYWYPYGSFTLFQQSCVVYDHVSPTTLLQRHCDEIDQFLKLNSQYSYTRVSIQDPSIL